jgi:hypothetical protein
MWYFENKGGKTMNTVLVIIAIILSFGGGVFVGNKTAPKEINQTVVQYQIQTQMQGQVSATIIGDKFTTNVQIEIEGLTNIQVYEVRDGKTNSKPNSKPNTNLPGWLPKFPRIE